MQMALCVGFLLEVSLVAVSFDTKEQLEIYKVSISEISVDTDPVALR